jgi:hypothetical protein
MVPVDRFLLFRECFSSSVKRDLEYKLSSVSVDRASVITSSVTRLDKRSITFSSEEDTSSIDCLIVE